MHEQTFGVNFLAILLVLGLVALVIGLFVAVVVAANRKGNGAGATVLSVLLALGLGAFGLIFFMFASYGKIRHDFGPGAQLQVINHQPTAQPTALLLILVVGAIAALVIAGLVAAIRKGGGWGVLGLMVLGAPAVLLFALIAWTRLSYMDASHAVAEAGVDVAAYERPPLIEMGPTPPTPPSPPTSSGAVAEVSDWSHDDDVHVEIDAHGAHVSVGHDMLDVHDAHGEDGHDSHGDDGHDSHGAESHDPHGADGHSDAIAETGELPSPRSIKGISHAPIILSKLPDNRPEWVDQMDGKWDDENQFWTQTVQVGPYETEEECKRNLAKEVFEAAKDFAEWHVAGIPDADAAIRNYNPDQLPIPHVSTHSRGGDSEDGNQSWELRNYRRGNVRETYHTKVETSVSEKPMPVILARVEFDQDYRRRVNGNIRHGLSIQRAIKAGSVWGIGLLGLVATLGGLRFAGANAAKPSVKLAAAKPLPEVELTSKPQKRFLTKKRFMLILAPVICTVIYQINYMNTAEGVFGGQSDSFWPIWVWFGCGIAFAMTFMPGGDKSQSAIKK